MSLNPLHCGAVVASRRPDGGGGAARVCLNPLHCGAVVASRGPLGLAQNCRSLNPLHCGAVVASGLWPCMWLTIKCLNPLHCGAVVASVGALQAATRVVESQSPSLRGSGRFALAASSPKSAHPCLNPLHCGAVVASLGLTALILRPNGVSIPFIAGQWSLPPHGGGAGRDTWKSQSPSLRGSGRFFYLGPDIGFIPPRLNPLHCGAVVAS